MWLRYALMALSLLAATCGYCQSQPVADTTLPGVNFSGLSDAQRTAALTALQETGCSCGCSMTLAQCRVADPKCAFSTNLGQVAVLAAQQGKDVSGIKAALDASPWAHPQQPKLLDDPVHIPTSGSPSLGPDNAPITLVEFSDFQCPYCALAAPRIREIVKAYPTQVRFIFKQFPLDFHPQANLAAAAALAAQKQGKFWEMHDAMYATRDLSRASLLAMAEKVGLNMQQFTADLASTQVKEAIVRDEQDGEAAGVDGTPALFINGQRYNGQIDLARLRPILDGELKPTSSSTAAR